MSKKNIIISTIVILVIATIGVVLWQMKQTVVPKYTGPVETIRLSVSSAGVDLSGLIWIADEEGYFRDQGLNVQITQEVNGVMAQEKVASGSADIATNSDFGFVGDSFTLNNLRILASIDQANVIDVVARKDRGINTPSDLKGKKIGVPFKLAPEFFLGQFLISNNLLPSQVNIIDTPIANLEEAITNGKIDAAAVNDPTIYNIKTALGKNGVSWPAQEGQDFSWLVLSSNQFLKIHPEAAKRFLESLILAENFVKADPGKSKQIMENKFSLDQKYFDQNWPKHKFTVTLNQSLIITLENEARWFIANKSANKTIIPDYLNFIYFDGLTQVNPETVTIIH